MRRIFLILSLSMFLVSCQKKHDKIIMEDKKKSKVLKNENFDEFFIKFNKDSPFQSSRIIFPLRNDIYDTDSNEYNYQYIKKGEWKHFNSLSLSNEYIRNMDKNKQGETTLNIQIADTGVNVDYIFSLIKGQWYLIKIIDSST